MSVRTFTVRAVALLLATALVASCGLPRSGPNKREILAGSGDRKGNAYIVPLTPAVTSSTSAREGA